MPTVDIRLLGGVEVCLDGKPVDAGHPRQRRVLAVLAIEVGRPVSPDTLIERVWGADAPRSAMNSLHSHVSRLRNVLADADGVTIDRHSGGYVLNADPSTIDLHRLRDLAKHARSATDDVRADEWFRAAMALWRSGPMSGMGTVWFDEVRIHAEAEYQRIQLDHHDVLLRLGRNGELLERLPAAVAANPFDERLVGQLMLALYQEGRQADALEEYAKLRRRLVEELGNDPGPPLRELHRRIIVGDGDTSPAADAPVPHQVPAAPPQFAGREKELSVLDSMPEPDVGTVWVVSGPGGVGKTWLATRWANQRMERFPDGQVYVDLRGFHPTEAPVDAGTALRRVLESVGMPTTSIASDTEARATQYRSMLADKQMLVVLDNARDTSQVLPLLPAGASCTTVITSRDQLIGLSATRGAKLLRLGTLDQEQSRHILAARVDDQRLSESDEDVDMLVTACGGLPLALGVLGARAAAHPELPLSALADELRDEAERLDTLEGSEIDIAPRAIFDASHRTLSDEAARMFALLSLTPFADFAAYTAASLAGQRIGRSRALLRSLESSNLIESHRPGRYRMHDLIRLYATERAASDLDDETLEAARARLIDHYLHTTVNADQLHAPQRQHPDSPFAPLHDGALPAPLRDRKDAYAWFDDEAGGINAAQALALRHGAFVQAWQLAWSAGFLWLSRGGLDEAEQLWRVGLEAIRRHGDPRREILAESFLGRIKLRTGNATEGLGLIASAMRGCEAAGDRLEQAALLKELAKYHHEQGDKATAKEHFEHGIALLREAESPRRLGDMLNAAGWGELVSGNLAAAAEYSTEALATIEASVSAADMHADCLDTLGVIELRRGDPAAALARFQSALEILTAQREEEIRVYCLEHLGDAHLALGAREEAREAWSQSLRQYEALHDYDGADEVAAKLSETMEHERGDDGPGI